ncbi:hypothetical protein [Xenorhabdus stockiae]|uniref:hypothetical protein n=1 Tax=Xenorhabdus stockiae TaxID=351614 RepID=UPI004062F67D
MLKECIDSQLYCIEAAQRIDSDTKAEKIAELTLKILPLFSPKVEESQRQQRGVWIQGCDGSLGPIAIKPNFNEISEAIDYLKTISKEELIAEIVKAGVAEPESDSDIRPSTLNRRNFSLPPKCYRSWFR